MLEKCRTDWLRSLPRILRDDQVKLEACLFGPILLPHSCTLLASCMAHLWSEASAETRYGIDLRLGAN